MGGEDLLKKATGVGRRVGWANSGLEWSSHSLTFGLWRTTIIVMEKEKKYTGLDFELARPSADAEEALLKRSIKKEKPQSIITGADFEMARPIVDASDKEKSKASKLVAVPKKKTATPEMSPAQQFVLSRPGKEAGGGGVSKRGIGGRDD
jgi:hypothetical protein